MNAKNAMMKYMVKQDAKVNVLVRIILIQDLFIVKNVKKDIIIQKEFVIDVILDLQDVQNAVMKKKEIMKLNYLNAKNV